MILNTFVHVCQFFKVEGCLDVDNASKLVRTMSGDKMISAIKENIFGFMYSKVHIFFPEKVVDNELAWLLKHVFIYSLDKVASNVCFICVFYIRNQTLLKLNGLDLNLANIMSHGTPLKLSQTKLNYN